MESAKPKFTTIDEYINACPPDVAAKLQTIRQLVKEVVPDAGEKISYGIPAFTWRGGNIYMAAWKKFISMYPVTDRMEAALADLAQYKTSGKGTVQFPLNQPLPLPLIRQIVEFRVNESA